jgi:hypothetical protein
MRHVRGDPRADGRTLLVREFGKEQRSADALEDPISFTQISLEQIQTSKQIELSLSLASAIQESF